MKISAISDVHLMRDFDDSARMFEKFISNPLVQNSDQVILLGDIFDCMVGNKQKYFSDHSAAIKLVQGLVDKLVANGGKVVFIEGNHDFHLRKIFRERFPAIEYCEEIYVIEDQTKKLFFAHGDSVEIDNPGHQLFRKLVKNPVFEFVLSQLIPYEVVRNVGESWSRKSRKYNELTEAENVLVREKFRQTAARFWIKESCHLLVLGHSHLADNYTANGMQYLNNGFFPQTQTFSYFENGQGRLVSIN